MIFVDTGAWFGISVPTDRNHASAMQWLRQNREPFLTTDFVVDETLTLFRVRRQHPLAVLFGADLFSGRRGTIYYLTPDDIQATWDVFRRYHDKDWSFTDCSSLVVMRKLGIHTAFAFDRHFRQFGVFDVVP